MCFPVCCTFPIGKLPGCCGRPGYYNPISRFSSICYFQKRAHLKSVFHTIRYIRQIVRPRSKYTKWNCLTSCRYPAVFSINRQSSFISGRNRQCPDLIQETVDSHMLHLSFCRIATIIKICFRKSNVCKNISILPFRPVYVTAGWIITGSQISRTAISKIQQFLNCRIFQHFDCIIFQCSAVHAIFCGFQTI